MARIIDAFTQFFDASGNPLTGGKLKFLESGTNNTDKATFQDVNLAVLNTNPVVLDAEGRCPNVFGSGVYKAVLYTSADIQIQQFDPVGGSSDTSQFSDWTNFGIYDESDIVRGTDLNFYQSSQNNNQGNDPVTDGGTNWDLINIDSTIRLKSTGLALDWGQESVLKHTAIADFAITFSNIPPAGVALFEVVGAGDWTVTYPAGVVFDNATAPTLATGTDTSVLQFYTSTGSTKVFCKLLFEVIT